MKKREIIEAAIGGRTYSASEVAKKTQLPYSMIIRKWKSLPFGGVHARQIGGKYSNVYFDAACVDEWIDNEMLKREDFFNAREAAAFLCCSVPTFYKYVGIKKIKKIEYFGKNLFPKGIIKKFNETNNKTDSGSAGRD